MHNKAKALTSRPEQSVGVTASRSAPKTFQFVDANPLTDAERFQNKILVRSNASNFHWRRVKKSSDNPTASRGAARKRQSNNGQPKSSRKPTSTLTPQSYQSSSTESDRSTPKDEEEEIFPKDIETHVRSDAPTEGPPDLWSLIVSGHHDPFETYPSELPKEFVSPILGQINGFLAFVFPPERGRSISALSAQWLRATFRDRALFHASLFCQVARNKALLSSFPEPREQIQCYSETIRGVQRKFQDNSVSCADENILSVYALAYHGASRVQPTTETPKQGPMTSLLLLHLYGGRLETVELHLRGLAKMLTLRGGVDKITLPGLAQAISYGDIILATQKLARPMLPFVAMGADIVGPLTAASRKDHPLVGLGKGFRVLPQMLGHAEVSKLLVVLRWIIQYTFAVDDYVKDRLEAQVSVQLADERNFVQHNLLVLTPVGAEIHQEHPMHRLCRLGTLVYSLLVVYPIPSVAAPFHRLAQEIQAQLAQASVQARWTEAPELILWVTVMGGIASIGSQYREWYLTTLDRLTKRLSIGTWAAMKEILGMFLWYETTSDEDGARLWKEIEDSSPFRMPDNVA